MNKLWIVAQEVYRKNVFSLSFIFMVLSPIFFTLIFGVVGYFISRESQGAKDLTIAVVDVDHAVQAKLQSDVNEPVLLFVDTVEQAQEKLSDGEVEGYLVVTNSDEEIKAVFYHLTTNKRVNLDTVTTALSNVQLEQTSGKFQLTQEQVEHVQQSVVQIDDQEVKSQDGQIIVAESEEIAEQQSLERQVKLGVAYGMAFLIFMFMMSYSAIITEEIASEKGTRIMEVILSSVSATTSFFGKLLGILFVIFTQIAIYIVLGAVVSLVLSQIPFFSELLKYIQIPDGLWSILAISMIFFVLGVTIYASLAAFFGSLVSRSEDVQKAAQPMVFIGLIGFYIGMYALANPNSPLVVWTSYVPLWTPFIMPFRVASDTVTQGQLLVGIISLMIGTVVLLGISILFYRSNVLIYSDKGMWNTFKTSLKIIKSNKKQK